MRTLYNIPNVGIIPAGIPFSLTITLSNENGTYEDEVKFPGNWLKNASPEKLLEYGITVIENEPEEEPVNLYEYTADKRWYVEVGGTTWAGKHVATDRDSQGKLLAEFVAITNEIRMDPSPWKFGDGQFELISNEDMLGIILTARSHIANSFAIEAYVLNEIASNNITTTEEVDQASWPLNYGETNE